MGPLNQMRTIEFNRNGLATICSLSQHHLPLLATLLTNDFTHDYYDQLVNFYTSLGPMKFVVKNVARYVKKVGSAHLSDLDIRRLTQHAFGEADNKIQRLIRQSLDSYNIDFPPVIIEDPMELKLLNTGMYELYMYYMGEIQDIILGMYDMRDCKSETNLPLLLTDWAFTLLTKKQFNEDYIIHKEEPIYPEFQLPPLDQLYIQTDTVDDRENTEIRWKILSFIMSLSNQVILALKNLPKNYLVICTALYALVKSELLTAKEADGILYTEYKFNSGEDTRVSDNFSIAGLQSYIQSVPQVDGVYFQKVMEQTSEMDFVERESYFVPIKAYRIYANVN
ncbi:uncharacterized protein LOC129573501 isoform X2 [Sitodiplosis mosellana]|uniref:uncharacterized protein LOC129573501 isoform X2 n=1 Tax=Sitodiplosis mosellana TaxID=263140 RepID=UPI0024445EDA|nr:uncharacterized protein LOC129573501 isoform X2 [Sitodiplosis mosellana]